jgi:PucR C-terminal helix-turn-helix domain/GGDEF-like domain
VAVRGDVDRAAVEAAEAGGMPLLLLAPEAPLHDIEQAIMRECALYQARREMLPAGEDAWVEDLLAGRFSSAPEAQAVAQRHGYRPSTHYTVAYVRLPDTLASDAGPGGYPKVARELEARLKAAGRATSPIVRPWEAGLAVLLPQGYNRDKLLAALSASGMPSGIGAEKPLLEAPESLAEAQLAAIASALLRGGEPACYSQLGADRLLVLLHRDHPAQLQAFVDETLGPLLRYDEASPTPILPTLRAFIAHGGRLRETASEIYVHRNTLAYRLDRAAEILGVDLKDPSTRLSIELALKALPLVTGVRG